VTPSCQPDESDEKVAWRKATIEATPSCQAWRKATPSCQPDGSEEQEAWRKNLLEGNQKRLTKRMAVAAQQAEAMRMAPTKSVATVIEENKSTLAALKCKSCGESGHGSRKSFDCRNFVAPRPPTCGNCGETGHRTSYCRS